MDKRTMKGNGKLNVTQSHGIDYDYGFLPRNDEEIVQTVNYRVEKMYMAKQKVLSKIKVCDDLYLRSMDSINMRNLFNDMYKSQRYFNAVQSWMDDIIENEPDVIIRAATLRDKNAEQKAIGLTKALDIIEKEGFAMNEKKRALEDSLKCGHGVVYDFYNNKKETIETVRIDPSTFFIDDAASVYYGGEMVGNGDARDICVITAIPFSSFKKDFSEFDISGVEPTTGGGASMNSMSWRYSITESSEMKENVPVVDVLNYMNVETGDHYIIANTKLIYKGKMQTSIFPYSLRSFHTKVDSVWGIGVIELIASAVNAGDVAMQLTLLNNKYRMSPGILVDASSGLSNANKVAPGMITLVKNVNGRKVEDTFKTVQFGTSNSEYPLIRNVINDEEAAASRRDPRAVNIAPNQLATTTNANKETADKRTRTFIKSNLWTFDKHRAKIRVELFKKYIAEKNKEFNISGAFVLRGETDSPKFVQDEKGTGVFRATVKNTDIETKVFVMSKKDLEVASNEEVGQKMQFLQTVVNALPLAPELAKIVDIAGMITSIGKTILPNESLIKQSEKKGIDAAEEIHKRIVGNFKPLYPKNENFEEVMDRVTEHIRFLNNSKLLTGSQEKALVDVITKGLESIDEQSSLQSDKQPEQPPPVNGSPQTKQSPLAPPQLKVPLKNTTNQVL